MSGQELDPRLVVLPKTSRPLVIETSGGVLGPLSPLAPNARSPDQMGFPLGDRF